MSPKIGPVTFEILQFEDMYGNKLDDQQWHDYVRGQLLGESNGF